MTAIARVESVLGPPNGVIDVLVEDELEACAAAKKYLSYFQGPIADWSAPDQRLLRRAMRNLLETFPLFAAAALGKELTDAQLDRLHGPVGLKNGARTPPEIAISDDADPNGVWYKYRTDAVTTIGTSTYWWDFPGAGYDQNAYYVTGNLFDADRLRELTLADWVAANVLVETRLREPFPELGEREGRMRMGPREFRWHRVVQNTPEPALRRVDVHVYAADAAESDAPIHSLVGFAGSVRQGLERLLRAARLAALLCGEGLCSLQPAERLFFQLDAHRARRA